MAQFVYFNERRVPAIKGLIELLGYVTRYMKGKERRFKLHYESFSFSTIQENLPKYSTESEGVEASIDNGCVSSLCEDEGIHDAGGVGGEGQRASEEPPLVEGEYEGESGREEEESYRQHAHIKVQPSVEAEADRILHATPVDSELDLARKKCPKIEWKDSE